ncbi:MAG: glycosyltransferase family 4 protein, partial [Eubacteriales bacterium]
MKLQVVCQHYYPESFPLTRMCPLLAENGDKVRVLTGLPNYPEGKIYKGYRGFKNRRQHLEGVSIVRAGLIPRGQSNFGLLLNYVSFAFLATIRAFFLSKDFDAVLVIQSSPVSMALPGMLLKRLTKKPLYIYTFDLWPESLVAGGVQPGSRVYRLIKKFSKWVYASADKIFVSSDGFRDYFRDIHGLSDHVHYLPFYEADMTLPKAKKPTGKTHLVFAGNIGHLQSVATLVKAAKRLEDTDVFISVVGDGSEKLACEKLAEELNVKNLVFSGKKPFSEMPALYASA